MSSHCQGVQVACKSRRTGTAGTATGAAAEPVPEAPLAGARRRRFLGRLRQYGLLDAEAYTTLERLEAGEPSDPTTTRASKIALFKRCAAEHAAATPGRNNNNGCGKAATHAARAKRRQPNTSTRHIHSHKARTQGTRNYQHSRVRYPRIACGCGTAAAGAMDSRLAAGWVRIGHRNGGLRASRERGVRQQLEALTRRRVLASRTAALSLDDNDEFDDGGGAGPAVDEEAEREAWFLQLDLYALKVRSLPSQSPPPFLSPQHMPPGVYPPLAFLQPGASARSRRKGVAGDGTAPCRTRQARCVPLAERQAAETPLLC